MADSPSAPPRRPRRWWTVLVQSAICVGLAAMVAWPERHVRIWLPSSGYFSGISGGTPSELGPPDSVSSARSYGVLSAAQPTWTMADTPLDAPWPNGIRRIVTLGPWYYRDAGLHVLLGDLFE